MNRAIVDTGFPKVRLDRFPNTSRNQRIGFESTFATVRHRTKRTNGCLSRKTGLAMAFKLMMSAHKKWRKLDGQNRLPEIIQGIEFRDGIRQLHIAA